MDRTFLSTSRKVIAAILLLVNPLTASIARADGDGYYCVGPDYLAYEFGVSAPHLVYVMRLTGDGLGKEPMVLRIPKFQAHSMLCGDQSIRIGAFDAIYTIRLDKKRQPINVKKTVYSDRNGARAEFVGAGRNLGSGSPVRSPEAWGHVQRVALLRDRAAHTFLLEFAPNLKKTTRCASEITTRVIELDAKGRFLRARTIFRGQVHRECGY